MNYHYKKKKKYKIKPLSFVILFCLLFFSALLVYKLASKPTTKPEPNSSIAVSSETSSIVSSQNSSVVSNESSQISSATSSKASSKPNSSVNSEEEDVLTPIKELPSGSKSDWNLILLNPDEGNKIDKELDIDKTKFNTQWVDSRAAQAYKDMCAAAAKKNITLYLRSGYRSMATQNTNFNNEVARYMNLGNSKEEATRLTKQFYTVPGHSEHHTGLAFDIITPEYHNNIHTLDERFAKTAAYKWLVKNCANYGFILRYPKEKKDITQINFEPWHYRYVGVEHAKYITSNKLCLEEYLELFN